jgi:hypothetical protein
MLLLAWSEVVAHAHGTIDQFNDPTTGLSFGCSDTGSSLFQTFVATEPELSGLDLRLRAGGEFPDSGVVTTVRIRSGGPEGPVIASATATVLGPQGVGAQLVVHFDFRRARLTVGREHTIEWLSPAPPGKPADVVFTWMGRDDDPYRGGSAFGCTGLGAAGHDYNFVTYKQGSGNIPFPPSGDITELRRHIRRAAPEILVFELVKLDAAAIADAAGQGSLVTLPFAPKTGPLRPVPVSLAAADIRHSQFSVFVLDGEDPVQVTPPPSQIFRGKVLGPPGSSAVFWIASDAVAGYAIGPGGWSFIEPLEPMLVRLGLTKVEIDQSLAVANHVVYDAGRVLAQAYEHDDSLPGPQVGGQAADPPSVQSSVTIGAWGVLGFREAWPADPVGLYRMELVLTMVDDVLSNLVPNHTDGDFSVDLVYQGAAMWSQTAPCPSGATAGAVNSSSTSCTHPAWPGGEPDLLHVFAGPSIPDGNGYIRGLISADHENHSTVGFTSDLVNALRLSLHEIAHNLGAVHGSGDTAWGFVEDVFLVGDFAHQDGADASIGRDDVIAGQFLPTLGGYRWWNGMVGPSTYYDPALGLDVENRPLWMMPAYLTLTTTAMPVLGGLGTVIVPGDFTGDGRSDLAVGSPGPPMSFQVAAHDSTPNSDGVVSNKFELPTTWGSVAAGVSDVFVRGDFNGDGLDDVAVGTVGGASLAWSVLVSTGAGFTVSAFSSSAGEPGDRFFAGDADGDGDDDLIILHAASSDVVTPSVALSSGSAFAAPIPFGFDVGGDDYTFLVADFNGDGKADVAAGHRVGASMEWLVSISSGTIFLPPAVWGSMLSNSSDKFFAADVDGDGLKDVIQAFLPGGDASRPFSWFAWRSLGGSFVTTRSALAQDVCITWGFLGATPLQECGTDIMLWSYGYGYNARTVTAFSINNGANIRATLAVFNGSP